MAVPNESRTVVMSGVVIVEVTSSRNWFARDGKSSPSLLVEVRRPSPGTSST